MRSRHRICIKGWLSESAFAREGETNWWWKLGKIKEKGKIRKKKSTYSNEKDKKNLHLKFRVLIFVHQGASRFQTGLKVHGCHLTMTFVRELATKVSWQYNLADIYRCNLTENLAQ